MKRLLLFVGLLFSLAALHSQTLTTTQYRYWFDQNRQSGSTGTVGNGSLLLDVSTLNAGIHTLHLSLDTGDVSFQYHYLFYNDGPQSAVTSRSYRYWFDRNAASAVEGTIGNGSLLFDVSALGDGMHTLNLIVDIGSDHNVYSYLFLKTLYADSAMQYTYWFDNDTASMQTDLMNSGSLLLDVSSLPDGFHSLNMKYGDAHGQHLGSYLFYKPIADSTPADWNYTYWFDEDDDSRVTDTIGDGLLLFDASSLDCGNHTLYMQIGEGLTSELLVYDFYNAIHNYATVLSSDTLLGTVTGTGSYECNTQFLMRAYPAPCYHFSHWSDGNTQNPRYMTLDKDTLVTAYFAFDNPYIGHVYYTACDNYSWHGMSMDTTGVYMFDTVSYQGCDSTINLHLIVRYGTHNVYNQTACNSYSWHSTSYDSTGVYTFYYSNNYNCASTDTLHLTVNYSTRTSDSVTACDSYTWNGVTYATSGMRKRTYNNDYGCISYDTIFLTINHSNSFDTVASVCDSTVWHDSTYYNSVVAVYMLTNVAGCDSSETLQLTVNPSSHNVSTYSVCDSMNWHSVNYTASGNYVYEYSAANGCPSSDTLHLTVFYSSYNTTYDTACDSYTWITSNYSPQELSMSGTYYSTFTNSDGCPGADTLHLIIGYSNSSDTVAVACDTFYWHGSTYTTSGNKYFTLTNSSLCDSVVTLHLTINHSESLIAYDTILQGVVLQWGEQDLTTTGSYIHTFTNNLGCDSTVNLLLIVLDSVVMIHDTVFHPQTEVYLDSVVRLDGLVYNKITVLSANEQMGVIVGGDGYYHDGEVLKVYAFPKPGYIFERWRDGNRNNPRSIKMGANARDSLYLADFSHGKAQNPNIPKSDYPTNTKSKDYPVPCGNNFITIRDSNSYNEYGQRFVTTHIFDTLVVCIDTLDIDNSVVFSNFMVHSANESRGFVVGGDGRYLTGMEASMAGVPYNGYSFAYWGDQETENPRYIPMNDYTRTKIYMAYFDIDVGIGDIANVSSVRVYADHGEIVVHYDPLFSLQPSQRQITVYNTLGQPIHSQPTSQLTLHNELYRFPVPASGVYLVTISGIGTYKVVVVK